MVYRTGLRKISVVLTHEHWQFLRNYAAQRRSSVVQELRLIYEPEIERMRRRLQRPERPPPPPNAAPPAG